MRVVIIASTNGSVLSASIKDDYTKNKILSVASDRECGATKFANSIGLYTYIKQTNNVTEFSESLLKKYSDADILFVSFYTKLFPKFFVEALKGRLINFHPSLLPACPGRDGFGDTIKSGSKFIGSTVHLVDQGMDTGFALLQAVEPLDPNISLSDSRHKVFLQQCKSLIQIIKWYEDNRVIFDVAGKPTILNATYLPGVFSPNLDFKNAINFDISRS